MYVYVRCGVHLATACSVRVAHLIQCVMLFRATASRNKCALCGHAHNMCSREHTDTHTQEKQAHMNKLYMVRVYIDVCMVVTCTISRTRHARFQLTKSFQLPALPLRCQRTRKLLRVHEAFAMRGAALLCVARCSARSWPHKAHHSTLGRRNDWHESWLGLFHLLLASHIRIELFRFSTTRAVSPFLLFVCVSVL